MTNTELIDSLKELTSSPAETEWIEFKENNARPQEIGEYISALGNSACYHKKGRIMTRKVNKKNSPNMFPIGSKILCHGYVIIGYLRFSIFWQACFLYQFIIIQLTRMIGNGRLTPIAITILVKKK